MKISTVEHEKADLYRCFARMDIIFDEKEKAPAIADLDSYITPVNTDSNESGYESLRGDDVINLSEDFI